MVRFPLLLSFAAVALGHGGIWVEEFMGMRMPDSEHQRSCRPKLLLAILR